MPSRRVTGGVLVVLLLGLCWQVGWRLGERRGFERGEAEAREVAAAEAARLAAETDANDPRVARLAELAGEREMLRETVRSLRDELERADRLSAAERGELELYRRIGADETRSGLAIDALERRGGDPATLRVTLVQARGRDRVAGRVDVVPVGPDAAALPTGTGGDPRAPLPEALIDPGSGDGPSDGRGDGTDDAPVATGSAPFDLRFFETLEVPLVGALPPIVEIRVVPDDPRHAPFRQRFRSEDIRRVD